MSRKNIIFIINIFCSILCFVFLIIFLTSDFFSYANENILFVFGLVGIMLFILLNLSYTTYKLYFSNGELFKAKKEQFRQNKIQKLETQLSKLNEEEQSDTTKNEG